MAHVGQAGLQWLLDVVTSHNAAAAAKLERRNGPGWMLI